jgi:hypothetical protein
MWEMLRYLQPTLLCNFSSIIQYHFTVFDFSKTAYLILAADGDEIQSLLRIIVSFQTDTVTMMNVRVVCHILIFFLIIDFVEFAAFVCALFYDVSVSLYVNMDIPV